ncbi:MAG: ankyrin repeat domain-containing protein [Pseudomonadota bacterium]
MRFQLLLIACLSGPTASNADDFADMIKSTQLDNVGAVKRLLVRGTSPNVVDPASGEPLLVLAAREGSDRVSALLLAHRDIQIEQRAANGNTALMMAAFKSNKALVAKLLAKGAIVTHPGWTPLHYAAAGGSTEIVAILLEHHAYIDAESPSQITPLMLAAREGQEEVVLQLLAAGADATLKNNENLTAAQIALRADKPRIALAIDRHVGKAP